LETFQQGGTIAKKFFAMAIGQGERLVVFRREVCLSDLSN
jgi:hypothetical protein